MPSTESPAGLYPLLRATSGDGPGQCLRQGTVGRIDIADPRLRAAFIDLAAIGPRPAPASLATAGQSWQLDFMPAPASVAVVAGADDPASGRTLRECLELAVPARARQGAHRAALSELPPLEVLQLAPHTRLATLGWRHRVELDFAQAWLQRPEWLLFDAVFDHPEAALVEHLPASFHRRFPLRAISFLGTHSPALAGAVPAPTLRF